MKPKKSFEQFAKSPMTGKDVGKEFIEYSRRRLLREYLNVGLLTGAMKNVRLSHPRKPALKVVR